MIKLEYVPYGLAKINEYYGGQPAHVKTDEERTYLVKDKEWGKANTVQIKLPFPLRIDYNRTLFIQNPWVHNKIADALIDALKEIRSYAGYAFLKRYNLDLTAGIGNTRMMKGSSNLISLHAYFICIDMIPDLGPYGEPNRMPFFIHEAFIKRGFVNRTMDDGMHYQAADGYP